MRRIPSVSVPSRHLGLKSWRCVHAGELMGEEWIAEVVYRTLPVSEVRLLRLSARVAKTLESSGPAELWRASATGRRFIKVVDAEEAGVARCTASSRPPGHRWGAPGEVLSDGSRLLVCSVGQPT